MDRFSKMNPKVGFLFFLFVIILTLLLFNPFFLIVSLLSAFFYSVKLVGKRAARLLFAFLVPLICFTALFNMVFASYGDTVLFTVLSKNFTLESLFYGFCQGVMFSAVILWISCYSVVMTSDKFLSVFSRLAPNTALVLSMVLSFLPRLRKNAREIDEAGATIRNDKSVLKKSIRNFSALITMTLEESIEVADSMKGRGFNRDRKPYSKYSFRLSDAVVLGAQIALFVFVIYFRLTGKTSFVFEPVILFNHISPFSLTAYAVISFLPLIIDFSEDIRWLYLKQKI